MALAEYAFKNGVEKIKPFVLVVAPDTAYAGEIEAYIKSDGFHGGKYADKVIKVDYKSRGENAEAIAQLLDIERPGNKIEIVIHVNMLSEGWDVTNLYTIVPLRAANSPNLVEQTIGRGLRLPYGKRTGVMEIDTLSIVSHDKFDEIIQAARKKQIMIREREVPSAPKRVVTDAPRVVASGGGRGATALPGDGMAGRPLPAATDEAIKAIGELVASDTSSQGIDLSSAEVQAQIAEMVGRSPRDRRDDADVSDAVASALRLIADSMIEIPHITISPGATTMRITPFTLDHEKVNYALRDDRLVYDFVADRRVRDVKGQSGVIELTDADVERYIGDLVADVAAFNDIDYDANLELIGGLCDSCIRHLVGKLPADEMLNCMRNNRRSLAESVRRQILEHAVYDSSEDRVVVSSGPLQLKANTLTMGADENPRPFDVPLADGEKSQIRNMVFNGFAKCLFSLQKFDSDPEREFAVMLEREAAVQKWFKPTLSNLRLWYGPNEYTPDFVVETTADKLLCEVKATDKVDDAIVQAKKNAALKWCHYANECSPGSKSWRYLLVPDNAINGSLTLEQAIKSYGKGDE